MSDEARTQEDLPQRELQALTLVALGMRVSDIAALIGVKAETVRRWFIKAAPGTPTWERIEKSMKKFGLPECMDHFERLFTRGASGYQLRSAGEVGRALRERAHTLWPPVNTPAELKSIVLSVLGKKTRPFKFSGERYDLHWLK